MALTMVTLTFKILQPDNVTPCAGSVILTPGSGLLTSATENRILAGETTVDLSDTGTGTVNLPATDNTGTQPEPNTWNWTVKFKLSDASIPPFSFALPSTPSTVDLADVARVEPAPGTYVVVPGPQGIQGPKGDKGDPGTGGGAVDSVNDQTGTVVLGATDVGADPAGAATTAQAAAIAAAAVDATSKANAAQANAISNAAADATAKVAAHVAASDPHGDRAWASGQFDTQGAADAAQAAAESYTDTAITGEANRADAAYDHAGAATTTAAGALASAKTYADNGDATTLSAANAYTDAHSGGGSGTPVHSADVPVNEEIIVLPSAAAWSIVTTSGGTEVGATIPAAVGDRIWFSPSFMRTGGTVFLDIGIKAAAGGVSRYISSKTSTPRTEGYAPLYPQQATFPGVVGIREFVVQAGEVDGSGNAKIVLAYKGTTDGSQKIYAGSEYDFGWFIANAGPTPA